MAEGLLWPPHPSHLACLVPPPPSQAEAQLGDLSADSLAEVMWAMDKLDTSPEKVLLRSFSSEARAHMLLSVPQPLPSLRRARIMGMEAPGAPPAAAAAEAEAEAVPPVVTAGVPLTSPAAAPAGAPVVGQQGGGAATAVRAAHSIVLRPRLKERPVRQAGYSCSAR